MKREGHGSGQAHARRSSVVVRAESPDDYAVVHEVVRQAFAQEEVADLVDRLAGEYQEARRRLTL